MSCQIMVNVKRSTGYCICLSPQPSTNAWGAEAKKCLSYKYCVNFFPSAGISFSGDLKHMELRPKKSMSFSMFHKPDIIKYREKEVKHTSSEWSLYRSRAGF